MESERINLEAAGLERSCKSGSGWIRCAGSAGGLECIEAWFQGVAYRKHRHDSYAIGLTDSGVQAFNYRGEKRISLPGNVAVLHPDEEHDGFPATEAGFGYRLLYIDPARIFEAVHVICGRRSALPFVRQPVVASERLSSSIRAAFGDECDPLAIDDLVLRLAEGLIAEDSSIRPRSMPHRFDAVAIERARQFLDSQQTRVVRSEELEAITGLDRYDLARQFRLAMGTSPYRYSLLRRLESARDRLPAVPLVEIALDAGFSDQAHFTRMFAAAFGLTPSRYRKLKVADRSSLGWPNVTR